MPLSRIPLLFFFLFACLLPHSGISQIDETISSIVDRFNEIENGLNSMTQIRADATHGDSDYQIGQIDIWLRDGAIAKVRNEHRIQDSVSVQEYWLHEHRIIFVYERTEWHNSQDSTVNLNEYRYYMDGGSAIREMSRSDVRQAGQSLDISNVSHQINDEFDSEYGASLYEDKDRQIDSILAIAKALTKREGAPLDLSSLPFRILFNTVSPNSELAFAWSIDGVPQPDWQRWETDQYKYLESLGNPAFSVQLVSLFSGDSISRIEAEFEPGSRMYFWAKWADDSSLVAAGTDYRWATGLASLYRTSNREIKLVGDLEQGLSRIAMDLLREKNHPYSIDATEAMGFIGVNSLTPEGRIQVDYSIESKFEGPRRNAQVALEIQAKESDGTFALIEGSLPDYEPVPTTWSDLKAALAKSAGTWLSSPPLLDDYLQEETFHEDGILYLYNRFGHFFNVDLVELITRRSLYASGPHYPGGLILNSRHEFGHYDAATIREVTRNARKVLTPDFVSMTRPLYEANFRSMAHHFQASLRYWHTNPDEMTRQKVAYLKKIEDQSLPEFYYLLDGNLAEGLMDAYSEDWTEKSCYLTGLRFWLRRACDGSFPEFADLLQTVIAAYEPDYYSANGIPDLHIESWDEEEGAGSIEVVMEESGALGIDHQTEFSLEGLQKALPGLGVREKEFFDPGGQHPAFSVHLGNTEVLTVIRFDSGDPLAFEARSTNIQLKSGVSTGDTFARVFQAQYPFGLFNGLETDVGAVMVEAPESEKITLLFHPPPGWQGNPLELTQDEMKDFILTEMRWMP